MTESFAKLMFDIYKVVFPAQQLFKNTQNVSLFKHKSKFVKIDSIKDKYIDIEISSIRKTSMNRIIIGTKYRIYTPKRRFLDKYTIPTIFVIHIIVHNDVSKDWLEESWPAIIKFPQR